MTQKKLQYYLLFLLCILTWRSIAQPNDNALSKESRQKSLEHILEKLMYFDSLKVSDSVSFYQEIGVEVLKNTPFNVSHSKEQQVTMARVYTFLGAGYYGKNDLAQSVYYFNKAAEIFKSNNVKFEYARALNNMAIIYIKIGNQTNSLRSLHEATAIFLDIKDSSSAALGYNSLAKIYRDQGDLERTKEYLDKALKIVRKISNPDVLASVLNSTAGLKKEMGDLEEALSLYREALSFSNNAKSEMKAALILNNLGVIHKDMGELSEAKHYFERAYQIAVDNESDFGEVFTLVNLADYYFLSQNYDKAFTLANDAYQLSERTINNEGKLKSVKMLIKLFEFQEDWEKTAFYQKKLIRYNDMREKQIIEQISYQETIRYKVEKEQIIAKNKEAQALLLREKELQRLNFYYILLGIVFVVLITSSLVIYAQLRDSKEVNKNISKQSEERKLLLQEVHHRVKNNFQIVSSMLRLQSYNLDNEVLRQNFEEAVNRINAMAIVHDVIYRQEKFKDIDSKTYLEKLIKSLRRSGDSRILITIDSEEIPFKIETLINLGIALNELITNSFKHAFNHEIAQPKIKISLRRIEEKNFELIYKDNGIGISKGAYESSFGMELIETIISNFDGEVTFAPEDNWSTLIKITFKED
ncbi:tetratricopeptide repeat-containing sensor histidine kinase [Brumimicrobium oceani]|uniref:histidine kinase n=1 Tax=Brumimicrobium oceani TaxID=2100725 RepID=A0A2U2XAN0_9FLAO|nr:sensor histidine kinase [Brumimicrobium oceani]PWH84859.1 hypothetical protein DIT68_11995 [Brumimicrobium oceani]